MKAFLHKVTLRSAATGAGAVVLAGASLLAGGCSTSQPGTSSSHAKEAAPAARAPGLSPGAGAPGAPGGSSARLASLRIQGKQAVIYTASLTVRAADVGTAASRATQIAVAAGGYVASEDTTAARGRGGRARVSIRLKIPAAAYPASLAALTRLGRKLAESQHAQDVTQTVADVSSRVASAKAGIAQLRRLLARAGSVGALLQVQDQINSEESDLEALQSQQRALAGETTYATVTMLLVSSPVPIVKRHVKLGSGFTGGLAAGWQALRQVVSWLLTGAGAVLPFAAPLALAAFGGYRARRWRTRRRAQPSQAE
jgi:Domain of unknown function (DUF4349)